MRTSSNQKGTDFKTFQVYSSFRKSYFLTTEQIHFKTFQVYSSSDFPQWKIYTQLNFKTFQVYSSF